MPTPNQKPPEAHQLGHAAMLSQLAARQRNEHDQDGRVLSELIALRAEFRRITARGVHR